MRIPSDFNDDNLYPRRADKSDGVGKSGSVGKIRGIGNLERSNTTRRLLRLVVGLVLVIFLMRHASRPEIYQTFFAEPLQKVPTVPTGRETIPPLIHGSGIPSDATGTDLGPLEDTPLEGTPASSSEEHAAGRLYTEDSPQFRDASRIVDQWPGAVQRKLLSPLLLSTTLASEVATQIQSAIANLEGEETPLEISGESWLEIAKRLEDGGELGRNQKLQLAALRLAAIKSALSRVVDGSVWRGADLDAFYGSLAWPELIASFKREHTGVLPLVQQPEVYRGHGITVSGQVVRGERLDATPNTFGVDRYWQLWLRVADGSQRPLVAIVASVPSTLESRLTSENDDELLPLSDAPRVIIEGVYLKRLAYRSAEGAELAPAVVGSITALSGVSAQTSDTLRPGQSQPAKSTDRSTWLTLAFTVVAGIVIAAIVTIRTNHANARLRALRSQQNESDLSFSVVAEPAANQLDLNQSAKDNHE